MSSFKLLTPPAAEPVTLTETKLYARIDTDADDVLLGGLITAARQWAETYTSRAFITQSWRMALDLWPLENGVWRDGLPALNLPRAPLQSVTSVQYFDDADIAQLWAAGNYFVDTQSEPGRLALRAGACWPSPTRNANGIVVTYKAGYGDAADAVPQPIKTAILQLAASWYDRRGEAGDQIYGVPAAVQALLAPYRLRYVGI